MNLDRQQVPNHVGLAASVTAWAFCVARTEAIGGTE